MRRDTRRQRLLLVLLLLTSFTLVTLDYRAGRGGAFGGLRGAVHSVVGPVEDAVAAAWRPVRRAGSSIVHVGRDRRTAEQLQRDNDTLRAQLEQAKAANKDAAQLSGLLTLAGRGQYKTVPARVLSFGDALGFEWTVTIDVGTRDHVTDNMTVVNGDGLVGRVVAASRYTSTVLLALDPKSTVGARLEKSGELGKVDGDGEKPLSYTLFSSTQPVHAGDRLVTFGSPDSKPFVPGVPIGEVIRSVVAPGGLTRTALVRPYVNFTTLDVVGVVVETPRTDPRNAVLPPRPTPTASPSSTPSREPSASTSPSATPSGTRTVPTQRPT